MSSVRGYGRHLGAIGVTGNLIGQSSVFPVDRAAPIVADWFFPPGPPAPIKIPYTWLSPPLRYRPDKPLTTADVTVSGGTLAKRADKPSVAEYGDNRFTATLASATPSDASVLAEHVLAYYATQPGDVPRARMPELTLQLIGRTQAEKHRILSAAIGQRIHITGTPPTWPAGMQHQIVEGIGHTRSEGALVVWNTSPLIGVSPGVSGPWFYADASNTSSSDVAPY